MTLKELRSRYREDILRWAAHYGARNVRVFGSVVRGDARAGSDVDFLVEFEPGRTLFDHGGLLYRLEELLGCPVDVVPEDCIKERMRASILIEATSL